jgi:hypothetical protein
VFLQYLPAERIYLHLPANLKTCSLKAQVDTADAGEQGAASHALPPAAAVRNPNNTRKFSTDRTTCTGAGHCSCHFT